MRHLFCVAKLLQFYIGVVQIMITVYVGGSTAKTPFHYAFYIGGRGISRILWVPPPLALDDKSSKQYWNPSLTKLNTSLTKGTTLKRRHVILPGSHENSAYRCIKSWYQCNMTKVGRDRKKLCLHIIRDYPGRARSARARRACALRALGLLLYSRIQQWEGGRLFDRSAAGLHKLWYPGIRDMSTWSKFGAHGEHGDVFLFSNLGAL